MLASEVLLLWLLLLLLALHFVRVHEHAVWERALRTVLARLIMLLGWHLLLWLLRIHDCLVWITLHLLLRELSESLLLLLLWCTLVLLLLLETNPIRLLGMEVLTFGLGASIRRVNKLANWFLALVATGATEFTLLLIHLWLHSWLLLCSPSTLRGHVLLTKVALRLHLLCISLYLFPLR